MLHIHTGFKGALASAISAAILWCSPAHAQERYILDITSPKDFPEISFLNPEGKKVSLSAEKGKLTVLHFWATWCVPCIDELPDLSKIHTQYKVIGLKVIPISMDGENNRRKVEKFLKDNNLEGLPSYLDANSSAFSKSGVRGLPTSIFIDENGNRIAIAEGKLDWLDPRTTGFLEFHLYKK